MKRLLPALASLMMVLFIGGVCMGETLEVFHADSLAGPMQELKKGFEAANPGVTVVLISGRSKELAGRILKGEICDVFAPSGPAVIEAMFASKAASWYVVFSANEMVVITGKDNPLAIKRMSDLYKPGVRVVRVTGETDMATKRTIEFIKRAAAAEGSPELGGRIIDNTAVKTVTVPQAVQAVKEGKADAGAVYLSAAVAAGSEVDIVYFPAAVNLSEAIRNAATVPATSARPETANKFVKFILSAEGRQLLKKAGQPPVVPPVRAGKVPPDIAQ